MFLFEEYGVYCWIYYWGGEGFGWRNLGGFFRRLKVRLLRIDRVVVIRLEEGIFEIGYKEGILEFNERRK